MRTLQVFRLSPDFLAARQKTRKVLHVSTTTRDPNRTEAVRVLLADDHPLDAETLETLLAHDDVAGRVLSGAQAIALAVGLRPLSALLPGVRVVMLLSPPAVEDMERARDAGASGCLTKDANGETIAGKAVRQCSTPPGPWTDLCVA